MSCDEPYHHHHHHQHHHHHYHQHLPHHPLQQQQQLQQNVSRPVTCHLKIPPIVIRSLSRNCSISGADQLNVAQFLPKDKSFYGSNLNVEPPFMDSSTPDKIQTSKEGLLGLKIARGERRHAQGSDQQTQLLLPPAEVMNGSSRNSLSGPQQVVKKQEPCIQSSTNDSRLHLPQSGGTNFLTVPGETINLPRRPQSLACQSHDDTTSPTPGCTCPNPKANQRPGILRASSICESELRSE